MMWRTSSNIIINLNQLINGAHPVGECRQGQIIIAFPQALGFRQDSLRIIRAESVFECLIKEFLFGVNIAQGGNAAKSSACSKGHQGLGFLPEHLDHMFILGVADHAVHKCQINIPVLHGFKVLVLYVGHCRSPEYHFKVVQSVNQFFRHVHQGHFAAGTPAGQKKSEFYFISHLSTSLEGIGTQLLELFSEFLHNLGKALAFSSGNPFQSETPGIKPGVLNHFF